MSFLEKMQWRYACKEYDKTKSLSEGDVKELQEIMQLSPSSLDSQPWKFIFVHDPQVRSQLAGASYSNRERIEDCDILVVLARYKDVVSFDTMAQKEMPEGTYKFYEEMKAQMSETDMLDWFNRQVYIALGVLLSACAEKSIDSTPMEGIINDQYDQILKLTDHHTLVACALGYRNPDDYNQPNKKPKSRRPMSEVISYV